MTFELTHTTLGVISIKDLQTGETLHNPVGALNEVNALYLAPSKLDERLKKLQNIVIFDVGLGAGANALLTLQCALKIPKEISFQLEIISFEKDLELPRFALQNASQLPHFNNTAEYLQHLLANTTWQSPCGRIKWTLRQGDFTQTILEEKAKPNLIYYEPYSPNVNPEMWTYEIFKNLYHISHNALLMTYSRATKIRAALLAAGFYVGVGPAVGEKVETTQAANRLEQLDQPLDKRWLERWKRSHAGYPDDVEDCDKNSFEERILNHPQWG